MVAPVVLTWQLAMLYTPKTGGLHSIAIVIGAAARGGCPWFVAAGRWGEVDCSYFAKECLFILTVLYSALHLPWLSK